MGFLNEDWTFFVCDDRKWERIEFEIVDVFVIRMIMKRNISCYLSVLLLFTVSCSGNFSDRKSVDSVDELKSTELSFEEMPGEPLLGNPYQLELVDDRLIVADDVEEKALLLYDLTNDSFVRSLTIGQGPNDVSTPIEIDVARQSGSVFILQRQNGICKEYQLDDLLKEPATSNNTVHLIRTDRMVKTQDGYIGCGFYEAGMIQTYGHKGELLKNIDIYPSYKLENVTDKYRIFQGHLCFNERTHRLAIAPYFTCSINFYTTDSSGLVKVDSFSIGKKVLERRIKDNQNNLAILQEDIVHCIDICGSDHYFYILYSGATMKESDKVSNKYILRFDLSGKLDHVYKVDPQLRDICVSADDKTVYAVLLNEKLDYVLAEASIHQ